MTQSRLIARFAFLFFLSITTVDLAAYWDDEAQAPYMYNAEKKMFMTYDDEESIQRRA